MIKTIIIDDEIHCRKTLGMLPNFNGYAEVTVLVTADKSVSSIEMLLKIGMLCLFTSLK